MPTNRPPNDAFTPIGPILAGILDRCRSASGGGIHHLVRVWAQALGPPIADNTKPFAVKGSLLLVHVSSSAWMHQLQFLKADLLDKLNEALGESTITDIKFKIGPI